MTAFLWTEKYRPKTVEECILPQTIKQQFTQRLKERDVPNFLLYGPPGCGKTTVAKAYCNELNIDHLIINASDERNIDTLRDKVKSFATSISMSDNNLPKVVIFDEADHLNPLSTQPALRSFIEEFSDNCRFFMTCNYVNKIIEPLRSRMTSVGFLFSKASNPELMFAFYTRSLQILKDEGIFAKIDQEELIKLIGAHTPDWRKFLNVFQHQIRTTGAINANGEKIFELSDYLVESIVKKDFTTARSMIIENADIDSTDFYRELFDQLIKAPKLDHTSLGEISITLNDYQHKETYAIDRELNRIACICQLFVVSKWKK